MLGQSFRMAFSSIASNKMRSFLTMLGIIIGIMAVVVLVSIVSSATGQVTDELNSMGAEKLSVSVMNSRYGSLSLEDVENYADGSENIAYIAPTNTQSSTLKRGDVSEEQTTVTGATPSYFDVEKLTIANGRVLKSPDVENKSPVAVLGAGIAETLFGLNDPVGENVTIDGRSFLVVGVLEDAGTTLFGSTNDSVIIPFTLAQRLSFNSGVTSFTVMATSKDTVDAAEDDITGMLMAKFKDEDSFNVFNQSSMLESLDSITGTMSILMGGIGGISLLVGGIGIMNIMLVSVAERTREIGIRKAVGAGRKRILMQFLIEALVLSLVGGLIGLALSFVMLEVLSMAFATTFTMTGGIALIAVVFSLAIGLIFGINPANKAAKMPPIEALRTE